MREKCIFFVFGGFFALFEGDNAGVEGFVGWCFHYLFLFLRAIFIYKNLPVMLQKTRGIVLRTIKYKDTAQIATIYTEVAGRVSFRVPVTRSRHASVRSSQFQPLALVELEADFRRTARVCVLHGARPFVPFVSLPFHPYKSAMALFLAEVLYEVLCEGGEDSPLFAYLVNALIWLDRCPEGFSNFHLVFLMRLLRFVGLHPNVEGYVPGCWFDLRSACFTAARPVAHSDFLWPQEAELLPRLLRMNFDTMRFFTFSRQQRARCLDVIIDYYCLHVPGFHRPKSLEVLHELFD